MGSQQGEKTEKEALLNENSDIKPKQSLIVISASNLFVWCCISLIAPFFPLEAERKGASQTVIGFIYSSPELVMLLTSPCFAYMITQSGARFFYISGLFVFGCCTFLFGLLNMCPPGATFIALCFAVRIIQALGSASITTASFTIVGMNFPDRIGTAYGVLEMVTGVGFLVGPTIGGGFYELGGFGLPFWVLGACVVICGCVSCLVLPSQDHVSTYTSTECKPSMLQLFRSPLVWYGCVCGVVALSSITIYVPVYAQHLVQLKVKQSLVGFFFVIPPLCYSTTAPLWGYLLDRNLPLVPLMTTGLVCAAVSALFFGPAPFFTFMEPALLSTGLASGFFGLSISPILIGAMRCFIQGASNLDFKDDRSTFSMVGGVIQSSICLGAFLGPSIGGFVTEKLGFGWAMVVAAGILLIPIVVFCPYVPYNFLKRRKVKDTTGDKSSELVTLNFDHDQEHMYETFLNRDN